MKIVLIKSFVLPVLSLLASVSFAFSEKTKVDLNKSSGEVEFFATGRPSLLRIHGKGVAPQGSFTVQNNRVSGEGTFDLTSLDTGIEMRNHHMKEKYLEVAKFPVATLKIIEMILPQKTDSLNWTVEGVPFQGTLNLHGEIKPVSGTAKVSLHESKLDLSCEFAVRLKDFGISVPNYAGITIGDEIKIHVADSSAVTIK